jgi:plasmid stabilization system protein ParE
VGVVRLTPNAARGYAGIAAYVGEQFGSVVAEHVLERIHEALARLGENPGLGHTREDLTRRREVLFWSVAPTLIAYRRRGDGVEVLFI